MVEIKTGICQTCKYATIYSEYDIKYMEIDCEHQDGGQMVEEIEKGQRKECPLWQADVIYCEEHKIWYDGHYFCPACERELFI